MVPLFYRDFWDNGWWNGPMRTSRLIDQQFGRGIFSDDLFRDMSCCPPQEFRRMGFGKSWLSDLNQQFSRTIIGDKEKFQVSLDVQQFTPKEITVTTVNNTIVVEAKHEEKQDEHGFVSRHFVRRYVLPGKLAKEIFIIEWIQEKVFSLQMSMIPKMYIRAYLPMEC